MLRAWPPPTLRQNLESSRLRGRQTVRARRFDQWLEIDLLRFAPLNPLGISPEPTEITEKQNRQTRYLGIDQLLLFGDSTNGRSGCIPASLISVSSVISC